MKNIRETQQLRLNTATCDSSQVISSGVQTVMRDNHIWGGSSTSSFVSIWYLGMPSALTTWAVMQAFMNINVTIKAEVLFAFWTSNTKAGFVSCVISSEKEVSQGSDATCYIGKHIPRMQPVKS
ncbi:hypothetical protein Prudu_016193 [Prunus dulcis]|uniref:Uncharacterized protein n=1 Tax=Prunus dulcis TaxID=3755 RepID=A0A4Y1RML7_PRUDU|nr:hypothetical protein Prudu_016193 [Prunus dulcis]